MPVRHNVVWIPHNDLGFVGHIVLVNEGNAHPPAGADPQHSAERGKIELLAVDVDDRLAVLVVLNMASNHLAAGHPLLTSLGPPVARQRGIAHRPVASWRNGARSSAERRATNTVR